MDNISIKNNPINFTSKPLYRFNIPKLVERQYEPSPALFSRLSPSDENDIKMVLKHKNKFKYKVDGHSIVDFFTTKDYKYMGNYNFYAIEAENKSKKRNEILGLLTTDNINSTKNRILIDMIDVRSDLQKPTSMFSFLKKRKYTNVGESLIYGISRYAEENKSSFWLISENNPFYDKINIPGNYFRKLSGEKLNTFIKSIEAKFGITSSQ